MGSFLSEHTAEYYLVPRTAEVFSSYATVVVPIYFWSTREGSRLGEEGIKYSQVRVIAIFARRPKVSASHADIIMAKLNRELFVYAREARALGIPTLAGMPLISSLDQLRINCPCVWFRLLDDCENDIEIPMSLEGEPLETTVLSHVDGPTQLDTLADDAVSAAAVSEWTEVIANLRFLKRVMRHGIHFGGYNPFHLLLID